MLHCLARIPTLISSRGLSAFVDVEYALLIFIPE